MVASTPRPTRPHWRLDAATGKLLWQRRLANPHEQFVAIAPAVEAGFETFEAATVDYVAALRHHFLNRLRGDLGEMRRLLQRLESDELL